MATRAFPSIFKKVKDISVYVYSDYTVGVPEGNQERRAVYLDPRGDTCLVIAIPDYVVALMGVWIGDRIDDRWRINGKLYAREYTGRLYQCGYGDDMTRDCTVIPWSEAAEATCNRFYQGLLATGQRLHDFLVQDTDVLAKQLETGGNLLLAHVEETKA
ncbi:hypothetical protein ACV34G_10760 [Pseudomonas aeruginosa]